MPLGGGLSTRRHGTIYRIHVRLAYHISKEPHGPPQTSRPRRSACSEYLLHAAQKHMGCLHHYPSQYPKNPARSSEGQIMSRIPRQTASHVFTGTASAADLLGIRRFVGASKLAVHQAAPSYSSRQGVAGALMPDVHVRHPCVSCLTSWNLHGHQGGVLLQYLAHGFCAWWRLPCRKQFKSAESSIAARCGHAFE